MDEISSGGFSLQGQGDAGVFSALANVIVDLKMGAPIVPYFGVGIGVAHVDINSDSSAALIVDDSSTEFAWNVMGGLGIAVTDNVHLSGGYRYFATTDARLDATLVGIGSDQIDAEIGVHELVFAARYEF